MGTVFASGEPIVREPAGDAGVQPFVQIRALFFATYRDLAGAPEIAIELPEGSSVVDLVNHLRQRGPAWKSLPPQPAVAVNRTYSALDTLLRNGDEVAFIPPVSGG